MAQLALKLVDSRHSSTSFFFITVKHSSEQASERARFINQSWNETRARSISPYQTTLHLPL